MYEYRGTHFRNGPHTYTSAYVCLCARVCECKNFNKLCCVYVFSNGQASTRIHKCKIMLLSNVLRTASDLTSFKLWYVVWKTLWVICSSYKRKQCPLAYFIKLKTKKNNMCTQLNLWICDQYTSTHIHLPFYIHTSAQLLNVIVVRLKSPYIIL